MSVIKRIVKSPSSIVITFHVIIMKVYLNIGSRFSSCSRSRRFPSNSTRVLLRAVCEPTS